MSLHDMLGFGSVPDHNGVGVTIDDLGIVLIPISNCIIRLHLSNFDNFAKTIFRTGVYKQSVSVIVVVRTWFLVSSIIIRPNAVVDCEISRQGSLPTWRAINWFDLFPIVLSSIYCCGGQGSLLIPKMEFFIKADIWGWSFFISMPNVVFYNNG